MRYRMLFVGLNTLRDIRDDDQLAARDYFQSVRHDGRAEPLAYPTAWAQLSETPIKSTNAAPKADDRGEIWWRETAGRSPSGVLAPERSAS